LQPTFLCHACIPCCLLLAYTLDLLTLAILICHACALQLHRLLLSHVVVQEELSREVY
jgi:hypothetical protein